MKNVNQTKNISRGETNISSITYCRINHGRRTTQMIIKYIRHNLKGLEVHINNIETYIYANLILVYNYSILKDELLKISTIVIDLINIILRYFKHILKYL